MLNEQTINELVEQELSRLSDTKLFTRIAELRVKPYRVDRGWDYDKEGVKYPCWTVLEHPQSNTGIAYCYEGFGPASPWGLVFLSGPHMNIGMDSAWYASLEGAMRESMAWDGPNPDGYESE
jgi:hypothetical protein